MRIIRRAEAIINITPGDLLVASPRMNDPYFNDSVILISAMNAGAVIGFILNRPTTMPASELFDNLDEDFKRYKRRMFIGGPVNDDVLHMIALSDYGGQQIVPGVRMGGHWNSVEEMLSSDEHANRLFLGYTCWGSEQLQDEIRGGAWLVYKSIGVREIFNEIDNGNMPTSQSAIAILNEYARI